MVYGNEQILELSLKPHEICIGTITSEIVAQCMPVKGTDFRIINRRASRKHQLIDYLNPINSIKLIFFP